MERKGGFILRYRSFSVLVVALILALTAAIAKGSPAGAEKSAGATSGTARSQTIRASANPTRFLSPLGSQPHSTGPSEVPTSGVHQNISKAFGGSDGSIGSTLPLGSLPLGSYLTNQFESEGIVFSGQSPFTTDDGSSAVNPTISGTPLFGGSVVGSFVKPGTATATTVNNFSLSVGYINNPGSVIMTVLGASGQQLGVVTANQVGFDEMVSDFSGAARFILSQVAEETAGWEINSIQFAGMRTQTTYVAMGDSYSSGEGTHNYSYSKETGDSCDRSPDAWPIQMSIEANAASQSGPNLSIGANELLACQGSTTDSILGSKVGGQYQGTAINGEAASELKQLNSYIAANGGPPSLISLTIGGNDVNFAGILKDCWLVGSVKCIPVLNNLINRLTTGRSDLIDQLAKTYSAISTTADSNIVVVGYPQIFPTAGNWLAGVDSDHRCVWLDGDANGLFDRFDRAAADLDDDIAAAAEQAGVEFAPDLHSLSGHELCTGDEWINALNLSDAGVFNGDRAAGHPTTTGQHAIATAVANDLGYLSGSVEEQGQAMNAARIDPVEAAGSSRELAQAEDVGSSLSIQSSGVENGTISVPYMGYPVATGGTPGYSWSVSSGTLPPGLVLDPETGTIDGVPTNTGSWSFTLSVTDSSTPTAQTVNASVSISIDGPSALTVTTNSLPVGTVGQSFETTLAASGGLGADAWTIASGGLPAGLSLDASTGEIVGSPTQQGTSSFTIQASDSETTAQIASKSLTMTVVASGSAFQVATSSMPMGTQGSEYSTTLDSEGGIAPTAWAVTSGALPPGLNLDSATGRISGMAEQPGNFLFSVEASDGTSPVSLTSSDNLSILIGAGTPLTMSGTEPTTAIEGQPYSSSLDAAGGVLPYSWGVTSGSLPSGLTLDPSSGDISGTPTQDGTFSFTAEVSDSSGPSAQSASNSYTMTVLLPPLSATTGGTTATVGEYFASNIDPVGGVGPYSWTVSSGTTPPGVTFDATTGTFVGTPTEAGTFPISIQVQDSSSPDAQVTTLNVSLTVQADPKLAFTSTLLPPSVTGSNYVAAIGYVGGLGPYTFTLTKGTLPSGLTLDSSSGMITGQATSTGSYALTVKITDSSSPNESATSKLTLVVSSPPSLAIATTSLGDADQGGSYQALLGASGGNGPYSWSLAGGELPDGLYLDSSSGVISGTPTSSGPFSFEVEVTDSSNPIVEVATQSLTLNVDDASPLGFTTSSLDNGTQGQYYDETADVGGGVSPYVFSVASGELPAGMTLDPNSGEITGYPTSYGESTFTLSVQDGSTPTPEVAAAAPSYSISEGDLPPGLSLSGASGELSGTPTKAGSFTFQVTATNGRSPNAITPTLSIVVVPPPVVTKLSPTKGMPGQKVTIKGQNLSDTSWVYFPGAYATVLTDTTSAITVDVPFGAEDGPITVDTPGGEASSTGSFTVVPLPAPTIKSIAPASVKVGKTLTIHGSDLQSLQWVDFSGTYVYVFTKDTSNLIKVVVPSGAISGQISIQTSSGTATSTQSISISS